MVFGGVETEASRHCSAGLQTGCRAGLQARTPLSASNLCRRGRRQYSRSGDRRYRAHSFTARPEYYGLKLAQHFAGSNLVGAALDAQGANVTAYAATAKGATNLVAIFNKDSRDVDVTIAGPAASFKQATVERLQAPSVDAKDRVTLNGKIVGGVEQSHAGAGEPLKLHGGKLSVNIPGYSAALIRMV